MPRLNKLALLSVASVALLSTAALAAPKADLNGDKQIDQIEFITHAAQRFTDTDANADGMLSKDEIKAHRKARKSKMEDRRFDEVDSNKDGMISKAEKAAFKEQKSAKRAEMRLKRMDTDGDGVVSDAEKETMKAKRKAKKAEMMAERKARKADRPERIKPDADGDGFITRAEFDASSIAMFDRLDANNDGVLTKGEGKKRGKKGRGHGKRGQ